ncbi:MAG: hypothetical protein WBO32_08485 [Cyclobacteriaceae bacterium]
MKETMTFHLKIGFTLLLIIGILPCHLLAQVGDREPEPEGGIAQLALQYFKINFSKEQRSHLEANELELIFMVDEVGNALLEKVNGTEDQAIIDSLYNKTLTVAKFIPQQVDGKDVPSVYFMILRFPQYKSIRFNNYSNAWRFGRPTLEDLEDYTLGGRWDMLIGGVMNQFTGRPSDYLKTGGGMKFDFIFTGRKNFGMGLIMSVYGNSSKMDYPINTLRPQDPAPSTMIIGLATYQRLTEKERSEVSLQFELGYATQNIVTREYGSDYWLQLRGYSPGVTLNYLIQLGKKSLSQYYYEPIILSHHLNIHMSMRYIVLDLREATGPMVEIGLAYRMRMNFFKDLKFKDR